MSHQRYDTHFHPDDPGKRTEFWNQSHVSGLTKEQREQMIAEAAYYIAELRHFEGGDPVSDWLEAQMIIDSKIRGSAH